MTRESFVYLCLGTFVGWLFSVIVDGLLTRKTDTQENLLERQIENLKRADDVLERVKKT